MSVYEELCKYKDDKYKDKISSKLEEICSDDNLKNEIEDEISNIDKGIEEIANSYNKERLINRKNEIIVILEKKEASDEETMSLEKELNKIILQLAKMK